MREKYLPIGTVVLLKGGRKRAMITGFCSVAQENQEKKLSLNHWKTLEELSLSII